MRLSTFSTAIADRMTFVPLERRRLALAMAFVFTAVHVAIDIAFFNLKGVRGGLLVVVLEAICQLLICYLATRRRNGHPSRADWVLFLVFFLIYNAFHLGAKGLFIDLAESIPLRTDFRSIFPFASGEKYALAPIADGHVDIIAKVLYECGMCVPRLLIPLNEPFIAYVYWAVSQLAGEFNQHVNWLFLMLAHLAGASLLLAAARRLIQDDRFAILLPLLFLLMTDVAGANLILFKDGLIATLLAAFLYLTIRQIFDKDLGDVFYEISTVLIVATIFSFRSGMLAVIACLALLSCAVDRRNALRHIRIACFGILMALSISSTYDMLSDLNRAVDRVEDKVMFGASAHLDVQNLRYTRSRESSVLNRLNLHEFNWSNFYYAPLVKGVLYILLPLPSKGCIKIDDCLNKTSSMVYGSFLIFFLYGAWTIVRRRVPRELYILAFFLICMAAVQGAGPMIYPRYRTVFAGTFALIAVIGMSRMTPANGWKLLVVSAAGMVTLVAGYDMFYRLVQ